MSTVSIPAFAKRKGVTRQAVDYAISVGRLDKSVSRDARGRQVIDPDLGSVEWDQNTDHEKRVNAAGGDPSAFGEGDAPEDSTDPTVKTSAAQLKKWQAALAELKYKEAARELIPVGEIRAEWLDLASAIRTEFLALPSRYRQQFPHLSMKEIDGLELMVREALEKLSSDGQ